MGTNQWQNHYSQTNQLSAVMDDTPSYDVRILVGDLNAQISSDATGFENVIGTEAMGERTDHGGRFPSLCSMHIHKGTWVSPDGATVNQKHFLTMDGT